MALTLHNLQPPKGAKKKRKRVGRGNASGMGTYSTRGLKGQKARAGASGSTQRGLRDLMRNLPKLGGFKSPKPKLININLDDLEKNFKDNQVIDLQKLKQKGIIENVKPGVKILSTGKLTKKLTIRVNKVSQAAKEAIEKAGGKVIEINKNTKDKSKKVYPERAKRAEGKKEQEDKIKDKKEKTEEEK